MRYFWALVLITFGVAGLGASLNWWDSAVLGTLVQFWPLILVFWGLEILFKKNKFYHLIMLLSIFVSAFFIWDVAFTKNPLIFKDQNRFTNCCTNQSYDISGDMPDGVKNTKYVINTGAVSFDINGSTEKMVTGKLESSFMKPEYIVNKESDQVVFDLKTSSTGKNIKYWWSGNLKNNLDLTLNNQYPLDLEVNSGASSLNFDLADYILNKLIIKAGASSIDLKIGEKVKDGAALEIDSGASSIKIAVPKNIGVKVKTETGLTSQNFNGFTKIANNEYESEGYSASTTKITMNLKAGASSIEINRY